MEENPASAGGQAGAGARETNDRQAGAADGKAARQGEPAPEDEAALGEACARVYALWLEERRTAFANAAAPTGHRHVQLGIIRAWLEAGASEATLVNTIKLQLRGRKLKSPPNTIQALHLSMGAAITQQLSLPLLQQAGGQVSGLRLRPSMLRYAKALTQALPDLAALNGWFCDLEAEAASDGVRLLAKNGFVRDWIKRVYRDQLDDVFGKGGWQIEAAGHKAGNRARGAA